jgi:hypothetical protein
MGVTVLFSALPLVVLGTGPHPFTSSVRLIADAPALVPNCLDHWLATRASGKSGNLVRGLPVETRGDLAHQGREPAGLDARFFARRPGRSPARKVLGRPGR